MTLFSYLAHTIRDQGPITVAHYMAAVLTHPRYGYYTKGEVFGREGDFITAPEISQMFGEMVGMWAVTNWQALGAPPSVALVELGPGKGTLMADILRATKQVVGFHDALEIHFVETSVVLRKKQEQALVPIKAVWHDMVGTLPKDKPYLVIANEFLDALPIHQYVCRDGYWGERMVGLNHAQDGVCFVDNKQPAEISSLLMERYIEAKQGQIVELCPAAESIIEVLAHNVAEQSGAALLVDYGYDKMSYESTLQAVKSHEYHSVLEDIGEADITAHVDFSRMKEICQEVPGLYTSPIIGQGAFLQALGIDMRAQMLLRHATGAQAEDIRTALARLTESGQMGTLFKVISFSSMDYFTEIGF